MRTFKLRQAQHDQHGWLLRACAFLLLGLLLSSPARAAPRERSYTPPQAAAWPVQKSRYPSVTEATLEALLKKAESGNVRAQMALAQWYEQPADRGGGGDQEKAQAWMRRAAAQGEPDALYFMTRFTSLDHGAPHPVLLRAWEAAAAKGSIYAALALAENHADRMENAGENALFHANEAIRWYTPAVSDGWASAAEQLGKFYYTPHHAWLGIHPDIIMAYAWRAIAQRGLADLPHGAEHSVQENRYWLELLENMMLPSEKKQALALIRAWPRKMPPPVRLAAARVLPRGEPTAIIADIRHSGDKRAIDALLRELDASVWHVSGDMEAFISLLNEAETLGSIYAKDLLALLQVYGIDSSKTPDGGRKTLEAQAARNDPFAWRFLGMISMIQSEKSESLKWLGKAAAAGDTPAMLLLGKHYSMAGDAGKSTYWLERAAIAGDGRALPMLCEQAEDSHDVATSTKWTTVSILRSQDSEAETRLRQQLLQYRMLAPEDAARGMVEGEQWHRRHKLLKKKAQP